MKLAVIDHERCGETSATTYVWVPDEWTREQFVSAVDAAQDEYLAFLKEWEESSKDAPNNATRWSKPDYTKYPDKTVAEVDAIHAEKKRIYKEWDDRRNKARKPFSWYLEKQGLKSFWEAQPAFEVTAYWGHRHGTRIDYENTDVSGEDLAGPYENKPLRRVKAVRGVL